MTEEWTPERQAAIDKQRAFERERDAVEAQKRQMADPPNYPRVYQQLMGYVKDHEMEVLLHEVKPDGQQWRHVRFRSPKNGIGSFDLITWPGYLTIVGDIGQGYTFHREPDMFAWFHAREGQINPGYWSEKVVSSARGSVMSYSQKKYEEALERVAEEQIRYAIGGDEEFSEGDRMEIEDMVRAADSLPEAQSEWATSSLARRAGSYATSEDEWMDFDHHFLLACHAILWGVRYYRAHPHQCTSRPGRDTPPSFGVSYPT